jgi:hypothetical protein
LTGLAAPACTVAAGHSTEQSLLDTETLGRELQLTPCNFSHFSSASGRRM